MSFSLFKKKVGPKVFAIVLKSETNTQLLIGAGYSLEEILQPFKEEFKKTHKTSGALSMSVSLDLEELLSKYSEEKVVLEKLKQ